MSHLYLGISLAVIVLMLLLFFRQARKKQEKLQHLIEERTSELKVANEKLKAAVAKADSENKAKSAFLASMSHEIRTPLNGVIGMTSLLNQTELTKDQQDLVKVIQNSGTNVVSIINDILDYSKIEAGKIDIHSDPFNLRECIELSLDIFMDQVSRKKLELAYYIEEDVPDTLIGDPARLRQILINLIGNAIKFTEKGFVYLNISLAKSLDTKVELELSVKDSGIGIPKHKIGMLFKSFSQIPGPHSKDRGGSGLGLSICKKLVDVLGGDLKVESVEHKGSDFNFRLPYETISGIRLKKTYAELAGLKILIVEDSKIQRDLLVRYARSWEMETVEAGSFADASHAAGREDRAFDLAVIDLSLPDRSGNELAEHLRQDIDTCHDTRFISITASSVIVPGPVFSQSLSKPIKPRFLAESLIRVLERAEPVVEKRTSHPSKLTINRSVEKDDSPESNPHILLVDDNETNRKVGTMLLEKLGHQTTEVESGEKAIEAVQKERFDIILMDVQMPTLDGKQTTQQIRELDLDYRPWIIAVTAGAMQGDMQLALDSGMDDYLSKPVLLEALDTVLQRANTAQLDHLEFQDPA